MHDGTNDQRFADFIRLVTAKKQITSSRDINTKTLGAAIIYGNDRIYSGLKTPKLAVYDTSPYIVIIHSDITVFRLSVLHLGSRYLIGVRLKNGPRCVALVQSCCSVVYVS